MSIDRARVLLCDVQGMESLTHEHAILKFALSAIAEAYDASLQFSQLVDCPRPQQGFGDAVWWVMLGDASDWSNVLRSYVVFAAQLLAASVSLPFVLVAPAVVSDGVGCALESPWTYGMTKQRVKDISEEGVPVEWFYSTSMHDAWFYAKDSEWRRSCSEPAPMLICSGPSANDVRHEIATSFLIPEDLLMLDSYARGGDNIPTKVVGFRVTNFFELVVRQAIRMETVDYSRLTRLSEVARQYASEESGRGADIQRNIAQVLDRLVVDRSRS